MEPPGCEEKTEKVQQNNPNSKPSIKYTQKLQYFITYKMVRFPLKPRKVLAISVIQRGFNSLHAGLFFMLLLLSADVFF